MWAKFGHARAYDWGVALTGQCLIIDRAAHTAQK